MTDSLTQAEIKTLTKIAGLMIPACDIHKVPGADDPSIIGEIVEDANAHAASGIKVALAAWTDLSASDDESRVDSFLKANADHVGLLQAVVNRVYYRNDTVMQSLGMEARAPFPKGFEVEEHDWSILDPVRVKDPFWRRTS